MKSRTKKLVRADVQVGLIASHLALTLFALVLQGLVFLNAMTGRMTGSGDGDVESANADVLDGLTQAFLTTVVVVVPLTLIAGLLTTHRIAGPLTRFRSFLEACIRGDAPEDMTLRKSDKLKDLCVLLNDATRPVRSGTLHEQRSDRAA